MGDKPDVREILRIEPWAMAALGLSYDEMVDMDLREFVERSLDKGIEWQIRRGRGDPGLRVGTIDPDGNVAAIAS